MACPTPFDQFRLATEFLGETLYLRASWRDVWLNTIPKTDYGMGVGLVKSSFTIERSEPTSDTETWPLVALSTDGNYTGSCGTIYNPVETGFSEVQYHPEQFGLSGPVICQDDLIWNFRAPEFLAKYLIQLELRNRKSVSNRLANIYTHFVPKSVANEDFSTAAGSTGDPPAAPSLVLPVSLCEITQEMLDQVAAELNEQGASDPDSNGLITLGEDGPIYPLYIGQQASQRILLNNAELRQDRRFADMGKGNMAMLFQRLGATRVIKNFRHIINLFPPRYEYQGGAYVRIPTWVMNAKTKGVGAEINPAWSAGPYEGLWVLSPWVFHEEIVRPANAVAGITWPYKSYFGEWTFITGGKEITETGDCFDPLKKLGRHFAEYKHASKPIFPQFGRFILFRRCPSANFDCVTCS